MSNLAKLIKRTPKDIALAVAAAAPSDAVMTDQQMIARQDGIILAIDTYVPKSYDGPVTLLFGEDDAYAKIYTPFRDWARIATQLRTFSVPGDHHFVEEHPEVLVKHFFS